MVTINLVKGAALGLAATVLVSVGPAISAELKSVVEIKKEYAGKVVNLTSPGGNPLTITFKPDGTLDGEVEGDGGRTFRDSGKWRIPEAGKLCWNWYNWQRGQENCLNLVKEDGISDHEKAGKKKLTEKEIRTTLIDHTIYGNTAFNSIFTDNRQFAIYYHPDGRFWYSCCEHSDWTTNWQGSWKIAKNELCIVRKRDGREFCRAFFRDGKKLVTDTAEINRIEKGDKFN